MLSCNMARLNRIIITVQCRIENAKKYKNFQHSTLRQNVFFNLHPILICLTNTASHIDSLANVYICRDITHLTIVLKI